MLLRFFIIILPLFSLLASGCAALPSTVKPSLEEEGEVFVFVEPFPQDAERLKFSIDSLALVGSDGRESPLSLALTDFHAGSLRRQRFLATGRVAPGQYHGLSCRVTKAALRGEDGESALLVPEEPVKILLSFEVRRRQSVVLSLAFHYAASVQGGFSFTPRFSLFVPSLPVSGLSGYAVNHDDNTVTVLDKKTGQVASLIATGRGPESVAFDQKARVAYVSFADDDAVGVIDVVEGIPIDRINLKIGDGPRDIALTPDGKSLLTVNTTSRTLGIIDTASLFERSRISLGDGPRGLLVGRTGGRCYVFNRDSNTMSVIDIANSAIVATVATEGAPLMGQFNRSGDRLYVIHEDSPYLLVINPSSLSIVKRVFVGQGLRFIKLDSMTDLLYAYRSGDARIEVYDPFTLNPVDYLPAMSGIVYMTIDGETNNLFLVSAEKKKLMAISLVSKKIVSETDTGENPTWVTLMGER